MPLPLCGNGSVFDPLLACVFDSLLPGVCLHASCHTLFLGPHVPFFVFN